MIQLRYYYVLYLSWGKIFSLVHRRLLAVSFSAFLFSTWALFPPLSLCLATSKWIDYCSMMFDSDWQTTGAGWCTRSVERYSSAVFLPSFSQKQRNSASKRRVWEGNKMAKGNWRFVRDFLDDCDDENFDCLLRAEWSRERRSQLFAKCWRKAMRRGCKKSRKDLKGATTRGGWVDV